MSRKFFDNNKDIDSEAAVAHRRSFIERMSRKLEYKESLQLSDDLGGRF
ncbi:MAG: hypothetical protein JWP13_638 [Candidatus Saccharibacteria bacterium]|nr:hypothetical protein [Candidatus Saccharibacteria bacterium]